MAAFDDIITEGETMGNKLIPVVVVFDGWDMP